MTEPMVTVRLPLSHWSQIVRDVEDMCGTSAENIEILQDAKIINTEIPEPETTLVDTGSMFVRVPKEQS